MWWPFVKKRVIDEELEKQREEIRDTSSRINKLVEEIHEVTVVRKNAHR
jgi:hypothetical protein